MYVLYLIIAEKSECYFLSDITSLTYFMVLPLNAQVYCLSQKLRYVVEYNAWLGFQVEILQAF